MKSLIVSLLAAASMPVITEAAPTKSPAKDVVTTVPELWSMPLLNTGFKTNDEYIDGNMSLTVPVWSTIGRDGRLGGDYLFLEPYVSVGTGGETAASLGVAWRHLFSDEPVSALHKQGMAGFVEEGWFMGASLFADNLSTTHENDFWQLGVGAEIGTRYLELRGNYYIPLSSEKLADRSVNTQRFSSSSTKTTTTGSGIGEPYGPREPRHRCPVRFHADRGRAKEGNVRRLESAGQAWHRALADRKNPIRMECAAELKTELPLDETLLRHILTNLLNNAVKYSQPDEPVHLRAFRKNGMLRFDIEDLGVGIPEADRERLFEAFHRAENVGDVRGTGLGLVIAKRCCDLHSGSITFESEEGVGTTFHVTLPIRPATP